MKKSSSINCFKDCLGIGIDVSKADLAIAGITLKQTYHKSISNELKTIDSFICRLKDVGYTGKIICESTGHYHLKLAVICNEHNMNLIVINPLQASKHSKAKIRKTKTDPVDAETLATMCITERDLPKAACLTLDKVLIRLKMGQLCSIEKFIQSLHRSVNQYEETYEELQLSISDIQKEIKAHLQGLQKLQKQMLLEIEDLISEGLEDKELVNDVQEIPGIASTTACLICEFDRDVKNASSWVAYVGLDTSTKQSGQWKGRGKISKRGNGYLRKRLFQSAWGAMMHNEHAKAYYDQLRSEGRSYKEALCIISKKLLRIAYQVVVNKKKYDPKIAFFAKIN